MQRTIHAASAARALGALLLASLSVLAGMAQAQPCCGDCDNDGHIVINELISTVTNGLTGCPAARCCGDCNGSDEVRINEIITSVENALDDCIVAKFCPIDLRATNSVGCTFRGRFNGSCGGWLDARLVVDHGRVLVALAIAGRTLVQPERAITYPPLDFLFIKATRPTPTEAALAAWFTTDDERDFMSMFGILSISDGRHLVIAPYPSDMTFTLSGCRFKQFEGTLIRIE
jgi:hypothetical protein